jgi:hypothetical protein
MKRMTVLLTTMILFICPSCNPTCTIDDIQIKGNWDIYKVEFVDDENKMEEFFESQGQDFEEYLESTKLFEQVEFHFKDAGVLKMVNPKELGGDGETTYKYTNGADELTFGGRKYGFEVANCDEIIISDFALGKTARLMMFCKRK